ncbi:amino acid ABC transporter permease [Brevibacillus agri]|uniref:ABC transporter permease n=1 Tax=Brevibacillus agri TaxID=51101 RepID=A0A3M8ATI0_9BACL|nr:MULTISPECIES: ABC transporter permease [Brevibacillus]ELK43609.1 binding-protein-dependent transport system inner membrane protein [Brevibacillus agri BAB-2500]MBG9566491.1 glycine/betaine ABC transporter [Brevibacillus agri]MCG5254453.1 ABC transporter permease [Brevibacillus agri]MDN4093385.1 ABC transporter permease [Brevibacillus agri]MDR9507191.1 ABC transporter permease [Brevibacillus agri]
MDSILDIIGVMNKYSEQILELTGEHLFMSISAIVIAIALGLPLAILMTKNRTLAVAIQTTINIIQTIPSISMLLIIMIFLGLGYDTAIVALALYSMLPIIANTYAGLTGVDKNMIEAGTGMGMTSGQLLRMVMIPLAMPIILAGVRVAAVVAIGAATMATFVGAGGLGEMILRGISTTDDQKILAGAIPAALLVILVDLLLGLVEKKSSFRLRAAKNK